MMIGDFIGIGLFTVFMLLMIWYVWSRAREEGRYAAKYYGVQNKWSRRPDFTLGEDRRFNPRWCHNCDAIKRFEVGNPRFCVNCDK